MWSWPNSRRTNQMRMIWSYAKSSGCALVCALVSFHFAFSVFTFHHLLFGEKQKLVCLCVLDCKIDGGGNWPEHRVRIKRVCIFKHLICWFIYVCIRDGTCCFSLGFVLFCFCRYCWHITFITYLLQRAVPFFLSFTPLLLSLQPVPAPPRYNPKRSLHSSPVFHK